MSNISPSQKLTVCALTLIGFPQNLKHSDWFKISDEVEQKNELTKIKSFVEKRTSYVLSLDTIHTFRMK